LFSAGPLPVLQNREACHCIGSQLPRWQRRSGSPDLSRRHRSLLIANPRKLQPRERQSPDLRLQTRQALDGHCPEGPAAMQAWQKLAFTTSGTELKANASRRILDEFNLQSRDIGAPAGYDVTPAEGIVQNARSTNGGGIG